ncbi:DUF397 domain-containing protein [Streptomyces sp. NPDC006655]|uniref:DUF397 domain-containing protein n=1 Tax=Streptomyces sp. NPDC006655 TaxID=3156898 RepID=UPI0034557358
MSLKRLAGDGIELEWFKSSHSNPDGAACVEVASTPGIVHVRDSKHTQGSRLAFDPQGWAAFISYAVDH